MGLLLETKELEKMDFKIPAEFVHVIGKMMPEIRELEILSVETFNMLDAKTFDAHEYFSVKLRIHIFRGEHRRGTNSDYTEQIKKLFSYTYNDYGFVSFDVRDVRVEPDVSNRERFFELFGVVN